jgi:hypothetical protein
MTTTADLVNRIHSLEKLLQLELASADLMDRLLMEWATNMRNMSRHNIALEQVLWEILNFCDQTGVTLGDLGLKAEAIIACKGMDDASQ